MFDAVDAKDVPDHGWGLLAGYVNGQYKSYLPLKARFPKATVVSIDVLNQPGAGQVCDIEIGDATPAEAPDWFDKSVALGVVRPTLYCNSSTFPEVRSNMGNRKADYWVAEYGPKLSVSDPGIVAWQYIDHGPNGENIDISHVFDDSWPYEGGLLMALTDAEQQEIYDIITKEVKRVAQSTTLYGALTYMKDDGKAYKQLDVLNDKLDRLLAKLGA